jgi:hypothetical protein
MGETALSVLSPVQEYGPTPMTERAMRISSLLQEPCTAILSQQSCLSISANNPATTKPDVSMAERQPQKRQRGPVQQHRENADQASRSALPSDLQASPYLPKQIGKA